MKVARRVSLLKHVGKWSDCIRCEIGKTCFKHVFFRGPVPCDILMLGEAPGENEDIVGEPFVGPAGELLDTIIEDAVKSLNVDSDDFRIAFTNVVCCFPGKRAPEKVEIRNCKERLVEFLGIAAPKILVCVGDIAFRACPPHNNAMTMRHPAWILRQTEKTYGAEYARAVLKVETALREVLNGR